MIFHFINFSIYIHKDSALINRISVLYSTFYYCSKTCVKEKIERYDTNLPLPDT